MGFKKGHKINVGRICSDITKAKISKANTKEKLNKICEVCGKEFKVYLKRVNAKFCSVKCFGISRKGKPAWNKGLKGYNAGKQHWNYKHGLSKTKEYKREIQRKRKKRK